MNKPTLNYWVDCVIGIAFAGSALTGLVFLLPAGRNGILGLRVGLWSDLHTWSSLALLGGVAAHLALHWRWMVCMTRRQLGFAAHRQAPAAPPRPGLTRRALLSMAGSTVVGAGLLAVGLGALFGRDGATPTEADAAAGSGTSGSDSSGSGTTGSGTNGSGSPPSGATTSGTVTSPTAQAAEAQPPAVGTPAPTLASEKSEPSGRISVACPHGYVNDPYPGQCRRYTDRDGDGICDLSVPGSGTGQG